MLDAAFRVLRVLVAVTLAAMAGCAGQRCPEDVLASSEDPGSVRQWVLPALGVPQAWARGRGGGVLVAVIDNGFDLDHPDLRDRLWTNLLEIADNGIDDDANGYVDDVHGWDFLDGDPDARIEASETLREGLRAHGTAAAGVVAAEADNGIGVAGACPECELLLLRARDFELAHTVLPALAEALRYAIAQGARIVSVSDGRFAADVPAELDAELRAAISEAEAAGVLIVASAGNDGERGVRLPAAYPTVLAVASVGPEFRPSPWTSHGPEVDLCAPGECLHSLGPGGGLHCFEGTSASTPLVAALAALVLAANPSWDPARIREHLRATSQPLDLRDHPELELRLGAGVIDFAAALLL
ncbi:MAG: S8 family serine peptidase [Myxococcales bacterium]|nr:S8 family serine peptidase [Myxococcales bacterium]